MRTVGDFKKAGLEFVEDDSGSNYCVFNVNAFNSMDHFNDGVPEFFEWRENTGERPSFNGLIDILLPNGDLKSAWNSKLDDWYWVSFNIRKWRPSLNQLSITTETPEEKEALDSMTEHKPAFTQAMADAGELPPVGSRLTLVKRTDSRRIDEFLNEEFTVIGATKSLNGKHVITWEHGVFGLCCGVYSPDYFKPVKSEREKAIDEIQDVVCSQGFLSKHEVSFQIAEALYNAGYRKTE